MAFAIGPLGTVPRLRDVLRDRHRSVSGLWQRYVGIGGALSLRERGHMKDISDRARLPSSDESIAPVTILYAQGHVVRVVGSRFTILYELQGLRCS